MGPRRHPAIAAAATDGSRAQQAGAVAEKASCKHPAIGMSAPITGPAGSIGSDQYHWAKYYVNKWNKAHRTFRVTLKQFDDQIDPAKAASGDSATDARHPSLRRGGSRRKRARHGLRCDGDAGRRGDASSVLESPRRLRAMRHAVGDPCAL